MLSNIIVFKYEMQIWDAGLSQEVSLPEIAMAALQNSLLKINYSYRLDKPWIALEMNEKYSQTADEIISGWDK